MNGDQLIMQAARFARFAHFGQTRRYTGTPYIYHPMRVAGRVTYMTTAAPELVAAAWLHDVVEDCGKTVDELQEIFGIEVASLVAELTNPSKGMKASRHQRKLVDRLHIATISPNAKLIKLIDRIDNLREVPVSEVDFLRLYKSESALLLEVLRGVDSDLERELEVLVTNDPT